MLCVALSEQIRHECKAIAVAQVKTRYPQCNLADCLLPWTEDFELDVPVYEAHIQEVLDGGYKNIYLTGTAGEGYALSEKRFRQVVEVFADKTVKADMDPQVGMISTSMEHMMERMAFCYEKGIRMFQITLPCWGTLDDDELLLFFKTVCGDFPDCSFLHYNNPRSKRRLTGKDYRMIADEVPNLVATKNQSYDYAVTAEIMEHAPDLQHFFVESGFPFGSLLGECSLICSYGALFPQTTWDYFRAGVEKDKDELFRIHKLLHDAGTQLFVHLSGEKINPAYDKTFVWLRNPEFSNRLLPPYLGLSDEESSKCREVFERKFKNVP